MRLWMAANMILFACVAIPGRPAAAQQGQPRQFPELLESMPSENTPKPGAEPSSAPQLFAVPASANSTSKHHDSQVVSAVNFSQNTSGNFVQPVAGVSEAWPSSGPRPSHTIEPVAAPPATPLEAPPTFPEATERRVTSSPLHTLYVHPQIPDEPPLLPEYRPAVEPVQTVEMAGASDQMIAPPSSTIDPQYGSSYDDLAPIPASPPEPDPFYNPSIAMGNWSPDGSFVAEGPSAFPVDGDGMELTGPMDMGFPEEYSSSQNLYPAPMFASVDPYGRFLPFGNFGVKPGNDRTIYGGGFFIPLWQDHDSMVFTELRGNADDHSAGDGYIGLGYRAYMDPTWVMGAYIYGDLIATKQKNVFGQGQLGFELMSLNWDIRVNGYAPGQSRLSAVTQNGVSNGTAITRNFEERAYRGFDVEIGHRILNWGLNDAYEVRWFMGGYGFGKSSSVYPTFGGPRSRLEMRIYDLPWCGPQSRLEFGGEFSYDRVRREQVFGYVRVRIPLGSRQGRPVLDPLRRRMLDTPVHRLD